MVEHVQVELPVRVAGSRRAMAALGAAHAAAVAMALRSEGPVLVYGGLALILAVPLIMWSARAFEIACSLAAVLVMAGGLLMAFGGGPLFWPAALPLLLASTSVPAIRAPWPVVGVAGLLLIPWVIAVL